MVSDCLPLFARNHGFFVLRNRFRGRQSDLILVRTEIRASAREKAAKLIVFLFIIFLLRSGILFPRFFFKISQTLDFLAFRPRLPIYTNNNPFGTAEKNKFRNCFFGLFSRKSAYKKSLFQRLFYHFLFAAFSSAAFASAIASSFLFLK